MNTNEHVRRPHALTLKPARRSRPKLRLDPPTGAVERRIREVHWLPERRLLEVDAIAGGHPLYGERLVELGVLTVEFPRETGVVEPEPLPASRVSEPEVTVDSRVPQNDRPVARRL